MQNTTLFKLPIILAVSLLLLFSPVSMIENKSELVNPGSHGSEESTPLEYEAEVEPVQLLKGGDKPNEPYERVDLNDQDTHDTIQQENEEDVEEMDESESRESFNDHMSDKKSVDESLEDTTDNQSNHQEQLT